MAIRALPSCELGVGFGSSGGLAGSVGAHRAHAMYGTGQALSGCFHNMSVGHSDCYNDEGPHHKGSSPGRVQPTLTLDSGWWHPA